MRRLHPHPGRKREQGVVITLVAVFMASVVLVMAALAIDLTTLYTARSEAQLAADGAALAGARVLANSGMTSSDGTNPLTPPFDTAGAESLAQSVAVQVASSNQIGGKAISGAGTCGSTGISVCFNDADVSNPRVTVQVTRPDLPTFFLRFWSKQLAVTASATAEAYNPAGLSTRRTPAAPVAPICVKPWLLPNIDPTQGAGSTNWAAIFDRRSGTIENGNLTGEGWQNTNPSPNTNGLLSQSPGPPYTARPTPGEYYPVVIDPSGTSNPGDFPTPTQGLPSCSNGFTNYQLAVAGCVAQPIACGRNQDFNIDTGAYAPKNRNRDEDTVEATECLIHYNGLQGDTDSVSPNTGETIPPLPPPQSLTPPFEFFAGNQNPVTTAQN
ncbi:MAG: pilus assembly protein TadG-related protein, partial [Terriglobales bacterium]